MTPLRVLSAVSAMLSGALSLAPSLGARGKPQPKAPKKYRKESEKERRARQAQRGSK